MNEQIFVLFSRISGFINSAQKLISRQKNAGKFRLAAETPRQPGSFYFSQCDLHIPFLKELQHEHPPGIPVFFSILFFFKNRNKTNAAQKTITAQIIMFAIILASQNFCFSKKRAFWKSRPLPLAQAAGSFSRKLLASPFFRTGMFPF